MSYTILFIQDACRVCTVKSLVVFPLERSKSYDVGTVYFCDRGSTHKLLINKVVLSLEKRTKRFLNFI
jgi:hypothetical protein